MILSTPSGHRIGADVYGEGPRNIVLVMGMAMQRLSWHERFIEQLVETGARVVRYDNRDVGESSRYEHLPAPSRAHLASSWLLRRPVQPPYSLADQAEDLAALLDGLGMDRAHLVGVSMGGMIAQTFAARHPQRTASLTSIMSTTGRAAHSRPSLRGIHALLSRPGRGEAAFVEHMVRTCQRLSGAAPGPDEQRVRELAQRMWPGRPSTAGVMRQLSAILAAGDRTREVRRIRAPTLVVHGKQDPVLPWAAGAHTARSIAEARFELIEDMGHLLTLPLWHRLARMLSAHIERSEQQRVPPS